MSNIVIQANHLGKQYRIGGPKARYKTLRESIINGFSRATTKNQNRKAQTIWALRNISFEVQQGDVVGIIGPNGAGKTTLLKILSRITTPTKGEVKLKGRVGSLLEVGTGFHPELTGRENIYLNGAILGMGKAEIEKKFDEIVNFAEIEKFLDTPVKRYSTGMGTRLAFAIAAHLEPEILLVDEVLAVGDLAFRKKSLGKMQDVSREGRTVLFVSHDMNAIRRLCKRGVWLDHGKIKVIGHINEVVSSYETSAINYFDNNTCNVERDNPPLTEKYFSYISIIRDDGKQSNIFKYGDYLKIRIGMRGIPNYATHFFEWLINDCDNGNRVAWGGSQATINGDIEKNASEIEVDIGPLTLTKGKYSISINMGVGGVVLFDYWHDAIFFEIISCDPFKNGYDFSSQWAPTHIPYKIKSY